MNESTYKSLCDFLLRRYDDLKSRLTLQLGNADLAGDALQETWLRLHDAKQSITPVKYPLSYLMRIATNAAIDRIRSESRYMSGEEVDQMMDGLADATPGPAQMAEARSEAERLAAIIEGLPLRRRRILILIRVDGMQRQEVAERLGVSIRLVDRELQQAHEYVVERMQYAE